MAQYINYVILLNKVLRLERIYVDNIIKLLRDSNVDYTISFSNKPIKYNIKLSRNNSFMEQGILEVSTDYFCFGFIKNKLCYFIVNCDKEPEFELMDESNNRLKLSEMFNMLLMLNEEVSSIVENSFRIIEIFENSGIIVRAGNVNGDSHLCFEFYKIEELMGDLSKKFKVNNVKEVYREMVRFN